MLELPAGATSWVQAGTGGLPNVAVYGLTVSDSGQVLLAATHGRGAYSLELPPPSPPPPAETSPTAKLKKIKSIRARKKAKIKGKATDDGGIASVTLKFGDHKKTHPKLKSNGTFKVKHRYRKAGKYTVKLKVVGVEGKTATAKAKVKVKKHKKRK